MSTILENPVLAFLVLAVFGFVIFMVTKMFDEVKLNKALKLKQRSMRIKGLGSGLKARMSLLVSATLAPVAVVTMMFFVGGDVPTVIDDQPVLGAFEDAGDLIALFQEFNDKKTTADGMFNTWRGGWFMEDAEMAIDEGSAPEAENYSGDHQQDAADGEGSDEFSETNTQVVGVDEMDNVLTDGKFMYVMNWDKVQIALAYTKEGKSDVLSLHKEFNFDEFEDEGEHFGAIGMYVDEDHLIVIGNVYKTVCHTYTYDDEEPKPDTEEDGEEPSDDVPEGGYTEEYCWDYWQDNNTKVFVFDKHNNFALKDEYTFSGWFVGTRKIGDSLYFVTNEYIPFYLEEQEGVDFNVDDYLPRYSVNGQEVTAEYDQIVYVDGTEPTNFTAFYGIDLETTRTTMEVVLGEGGYNLYVSTENIYLAGTRYIWNDALFLEGDAVTENAEVDDEEPPYEYSTSIIRIAINNGSVDYTGTGEVEGIGLDQFSMDEHNGFLRVVTTTPNWWWWGDGEDEINNRLIILDENLEEVSRIEKIGKPNESVQSTRFVGDYGYIVTFLQTDPFYVIDLSDPYNPVITDELVIPGFSDFLQPLGEDFMLGIGYGDHEGGTQGLKISLYDVSDKSNAFVASEIIYPYSEGDYMWTSTVYNHKDLLVSVSKGIIALPYTRNGYDDETNNWTYNTGILVLNLDLDTGLISERAKVEHSAGNSYDTYVYKSKFITDKDDEGNIVEEYFYTISSKYIKVSTLDDPETILNSVQIGESWNELEMPVEVEPDGSGVVDPGEPTDGILGEIEHIKDWAELPVEDGEEFMVYVYGDSCDECIELEELVYEFYIENPSGIALYIVNTSDVAGDAPEGVDLDLIPGILQFNNSEYQDVIYGIEQIISYFDSLK